jgi:thiamine biosynthesis lipoprotein
MTARLRRIGLLVWLAAGAACSAGTSDSIRTVGGLAQGTTYSLQWTGGGTPAQVDAAAAAELERIDALLSNYRPDSTLERFNSARTTEPIQLPSELVGLFNVAKTVHAASDGCFDPTVRPLVRAWGFDGETPSVPSAAAIEAARTIVGLDKLELIDASHVRKLRPELEVDMASIGQGYTAQRLAQVLELHGSTNYLAEIGGEVVTRGAKPGDTPWRIGIENPTRDANGAAPALAMPAEARTAVITSGSYRHFLEVDGRRFGHIIDPRSGWPVEHSLLSVTVVSSEAATAAAWATALLCLGPASAKAASDRENLAALLWTGDGGGAAALEVSPTFARDWSRLLEESAAR